MTIVAAERARETLGAEEPGTAMALRIVLQAARLLGAKELVAIASAHIDGCLYHGDSGVHFAERLVALGARTAVPTTLNVGALDLLHPDLVRLDAHRRAMARRLMDAHLKLGCAATWTCAPYQAGHRPRKGTHVAWGESNAIAARTFSMIVPLSGYDTSPTTFICVRSVFTMLPEIKARDEAGGAGYLPSEICNLWIRSIVFWKNIQ